MVEDSGITVTPNLLEGILAKQRQRRQDAKQSAAKSTTYAVPMPVSTLTKLDVAVSQMAYV
jgi:hypothetical protein